MRDLQNRTPTPFRFSSFLPSESRRCVPLPRLPIARPLLFLLPLPCVLFFFLPASSFPLSFFLFFLLLSASLPALSFLRRSASFPFVSFPFLSVLVPVPSFRFFLLVLALPFFPPFLRFLEEFVALSARYRCVLAPPMFICVITASTWTSSRALFTHPLRAHPLHHCGWRHCRALFLLLCGGFPGAALFTCVPSFARTLFPY